jgi:hypothetical protein
MGSLFPGEGPVRFLLVGPGSLEETAAAVFDQAAHAGSVGAVMNDDQVIVKADRVRDEPFQQLAFFVHAYDQRQGRHARE